MQIRQGCDTSSLRMELIAHDTHPSKRFIHMQLISAVIDPLNHGLVPRTGRGRKWRHIDIMRCKMPHHMLYIC